MSRGVYIMPKKANPELKNESGNYKSIAKNANEFNKNNYDVLTIRIPKGTKEELKNYQEKMYQENPEDSKYSSVNALVKALLEAETNIELN